MQRWCKYKKHPLAEAFEARANGQDVDKESGVMKRKTFAAVTSQQVAQLAGVSQS
ncbi:LacI family transcriptional regulator, partial [Enterobacter hormaechei]